METASRETVTTTPPIEDIPLVGEERLASVVLVKSSVFVLCPLVNEWLSGFWKKTQLICMWLLCSVGPGSPPVLDPSQVGQIKACFNSSRRFEFL